jgi:hypothetical protein
LRWEKDHAEVYLFGVNYTVPFAYGYRSVKRSIRMYITWHAWALMPSGFISGTQKYLIPPATCFKMSI